MKGRILIVEDETALAQGMKSLLHYLGYEADIASNGREGLSALKSSNYDLLITDLLMPVMSGIDLIKAARADSELLDIPILVITAAAHLIEREKIREIELLEKPIPFEDMMARVEEIFQGIQAAKS